VTEKLRTFATGATRSPLAGKLEYDGYLNPLALKRFAEYMNKHQTQSNGERRAADNWQKNIPLESLHDSKTRHDVDVWLHIKGYPEEATESIEESLCAAIFGNMAMLKQILEQSGRGLGAFVLAGGPDA
jgi:hypothetical protein